MHDDAEAVEESVSETLDFVVWNTDNAVVDDLELASESVA